MTNKQNNQCEERWNEKTPGGVTFPVVCGAILPCKEHTKDRYTEKKEENCKGCNYEKEYGEKWEYHTCGKKQDHIVDANEMVTSQSKIEEMYKRVSPLVEKMIAKYPVDISGLDPALTNDVAEIALVIAQEARREVFEKILEKKREVFVGDSFYGGSGFDAVDTDDIKEIAKQYGIEV